MGDGLFRTSASHGYQAAWRLDSLRGCSLAWQAGAKRFPGYRKITRCPNLGKGSFLALVSLFLQLDVNGQIILVGNHVDVERVAAEFSKAGRW